MFSPDFSAPSTSSGFRNHRRRQRNANDDSVKLPKAKRQRSALRNDTFTPLDDSEVNTIAGHGQTNGDTGVNGHSSATTATAPNGTGVAGSQSDATPSTRQTRSSGNAGLQELPIRAYKKGHGEKRGERGDRGDGSVVLSKNDHYAVSQLPALPDSLRRDIGAPFNTIISSEYSYALALSHTQALLWPYNASSSSPPAKDTFSFNLPFPSKSNDDPLPLGSFVSRSSSNQPGLVVIAPTTGKVTYWEDISNTALLGIVRQKQNGIQGSVALLSSETITTIENAEPAGFMLTFSSSRVAHLTVRDPQGKPAVNVQFLRGPGSGGASGGLLGSVRNIFGVGGWRKDVAAVRAGRTRQRGQRDVIIATKNGTFELWDAFWSIGTNLRGSVDAKRPILQTLDPEISVTENQQSSHFQLLDFAFADERRKRSELAIAGNNAPTPIVTLVCLTEHSAIKYYLVELILHNDDVNVEVVHPITCYGGIPQVQPTWKARLCIPKPGQIAFVIFQTAVVLFSLLRYEESPSSQLALETDSLPPPFQDCIEFRNNRAYHVNGLGVEDQTSEHKFASCVIMIQGYGVVRLTTYPQTEKEEDIQPAKVTAKSKIEQAVFFGALKQNPLDFSARKEQSFTQTEINDAALEIQNEILNSSSKFLPEVAPSIDRQLLLRATALEDLAGWLKRQCDPLPRSTRWQLLAGAEKMASCRALWRVEADHMSKKGQGETTFLTNMLRYISENHKSEIDQSKGENDQVRHWFIRDSARVDIVIAWAFQTIKEAYIDGVKDMKAIVGLLSEASDVLLAVLEAAFRFRQDNASLYGLGGEDLEEGVLQEGLEGLPEFWTSSRLGLDQTRELISVVQKTLGSESWSQAAEPTIDTLEKLGLDTPRLVKVYSQMVDERSRWCLDQSNQKLRIEGEELRASQKNDRREMILAIANVMLVDEAVELSLKYKDMDTLVTVVTETIDAIQALSRKRGVDPETAMQYRSELDEWSQKTDSYFDQFGDDWAQALFMRYIEQGLSGRIFSLPAKHQPYLTRFFQRNPGYEKLSWIHEIIGEGNYKQASSHLKHVAFEEETNVWSKKVELTIGKLAKLASIEENFKGTGIPKERVDHAKEALDSQEFRRQLALINVQELLYNHIRRVLENALDRDAELQLVTEQYAKDVVVNTPALAHVLRDCLSKLVARQTMSVEELIDTLTLIDELLLNPDEQPSDVKGREFYLALHVLDASGFGSARKELLEKIIWRRCMIRDNWISINKTANKNDDQIERETSATALFRTLRDRYSDALFPKQSNNPSSESQFHPLPPSSCLDAGTAPDDWRSRFANTDGLDEQIAEDMKGEHDLLRKYMDKGRLEKWWPGMVEAAKASVRDEADERGEAMGSALKNGVIGGEIEDGVVNEAVEGNTVEDDVQGRSNIDRDVEMEMV